MLLEAAVVGVSVIPVLFIGKLIAISISGWRWSIPIVQGIVGAIAGYVLMQTLAFFSLSAVIAMTIYPLIINISAIIYKRNQRTRALDGKYGEETQWATELVDSGDEHFTIAVNALPERELMEIGIIAESKEELRELTIERFNELADDSIPEDFA